MRLWTGHIIIWIINLQGYVSSIYVTTDNKSNTAEVKTVNSEHVEIKQMELWEFILEVFLKSMEAYFQEYKKLVTDTKYSATCVKQS